MTPHHDTAAITDTIIAVLSQDIADGYTQRGDPKPTAHGQGNAT